MADIDVTDVGELDDGYAARVQVTMKGQTYRYRVTVSGEDYQRWGQGFGSPKEFFYRCMELLTERVSPDALMDQFDIREARQFYPAFEQEMFSTLE